MAHPPLWPHQEVTLSYLDRVAAGNPPHWLLDLSSPGTGKTRVHIEAFARRRLAGGGRALVVATKAIMRPVWEADAARFAPALLVAHADAGRRRAAFDSGADVVVINVDGVKEVEPAWLKGFDTLISDELTYFKHSTSARARALAKLSRQFKYRVGLTGTPTANSILDLWHQVYILDGGQTLGSSFYRFRSQFCTPEEGAFGVAWKDKPNAEALAMQLLQGHVVRHNFSDVMTHIPPNTTRTITYTLPAKLRKLYEKFEADAVLELQDDAITAVNAAVLRNRLLQICSGAVYSELSVQVLDAGRYELICDLIAERDHTVTFFVWRHQRDQIAKMAETRGLTYAILDGTTPDRERHQIIQEFQAGKYRTLLLHPQTGAHGLTLTRATATLWCSPIYQPDFLSQGLHRIYRGGQTKPTENLLIEAVDTVEAIAYDILNTKGTKMNTLLELIEEAQKRRCA